VREAEFEKIRSAEMCKHKHIIYLGKQELISKGKYLVLFNCQDCFSTISLQLKKFKKEEIVSKRMMGAGKA
jgi:hypothetical protein